MQTDVRFLNDLREDLVEAAWRESVTGRAQRPRRAGRLPRSRWVIVALGAVVLLVGAGVIGFVALSADDAYDMRALPGVTGATGATGASAWEVHDESAIPSPVPAQAHGEFGNLAGVEAGFAGSVLGPDTARIVKTAGITIVVPNGSFRERFAEASDVAERYGGFVESATTRERSGSITLRVEAGRFGDAMDDLRSLGDPQSVTVRGHDVTASYVDLEARLEIATARRDVLLDLMAQATTIEQTLRVQNALDDVQLRIEQIQGELTLLDDQTSMATIEATLREAGAPVELTQEEVQAPSLGSAWRHAIAGFFRALFAVFVGLGYLLPLALLAAVVFGIVLLIRRRRAAA
jgi:hypothetical protein